MVLGVEPRSCLSSPRFCRAPELDLPRLLSCLLLEAQCCWKGKGSTSRKETSENAVSPLLKGKGVLGLLGLTLRGRQVCSKYALHRSSAWGRQKTTILGKSRFFALGLATVLDSISGYRTRIWLCSAPSWGIQVFNSSSASLGHRNLVISPVERQPPG